MYDGETEIVQPARSSARESPYPVRHTPCFTGLLK